MSASSSGAFQRTTGNSLIDELLLQNDQHSSSTTTDTARRSGDSPVKIIDVRRSKASSSSSQRNAAQQVDYESRTYRNSTGAAAKQHHQQQQQVKQQSGETLSSFESDYDLLVYLGETETEDIVDTERSLDYQDQTWRQSICGGASLAPTIDENLSELTNQPAQPWDLELLGPPPVRSASKLGTLSSSSSRNLQVPSRSQVIVPLPQPPAGVAVNEDSGDECDNEVSLVFEQPGGKQTKSTGNLQVSSSSGGGNKSSSTNLKLGDRLASLFNRSPARDDDQVLINRSRTLGRPSAAADERSSRMALSASDAAELDRLLAEMSQSLDLDALSQYDTRGHSGVRVAVPANRDTRTLPDQRLLPENPQVVAARAKAASALQQPQQRLRMENLQMSDTSSSTQLPRRPYTSMSKLESQNPHFHQPMKMKQSNQVESQMNPKLTSYSTEPTTKRVIATDQLEVTNAANSCESILDEYDGASRMLEQMISDQLINSTQPQRTKISANPTGARLFGAQPVVAHLKKKDLPEETARTIAINSSTVIVKPMNERSRKTSEDYSTATTENSVVLVAPTSRKVPANVPKVSPIKKQSKRRSPSSSPPPKPPAVDYGDDQEVIRVEAAAPPSSASDEDDDDEVGGAHPESQMGKMKRRTLSSMRSMRHKLSDLVAGKSTATTPQPVVVSVGSQPLAPKRSSSINSRSSATAAVASAEVPATAVGVAPTSGSRPSRAKRRAPEPPQQQQQQQQQQSFGQQIRERLSRSKSRFTRFLRPKRAQSQPNTKQELVEAVEEVGGVAASGSLFEPGDIARNSELAAATATGKQRSSFDESLDRHIAAKLSGNTAAAAAAATKHTSGTSSGEGSLSGLDTRPSRDRRRRRRSTGSKTGGAGRSTSLLSIKRLSASLRSSATKTAPDAKTTIEDLDSMRVSARDTPTSRRRKAGTANNRSSSSDSAASPLTTSRPPTTNDYFGQVAPARVSDSDDGDDGDGDGEQVANRSAPVSTINKSARSLNLEPLPPTSGDQSSEQEEPKRPSRSVSMRSMNATAGGATIDCKSGALPTPTTSTFRPVSACALLPVPAPEEPTRVKVVDEEVKVVIPEQQVVKPMRPGNSPLPGYPPHIASARPAQFEKGRGQRPASSPKRTLGERCRDLFGRPASPREVALKPGRVDLPPAVALTGKPSHSSSPLAQPASPQPGARNALVPYPPPKRPPRNRSKSVNARSSSPEPTEEAHSSSCQVIEVAAASPGSSLEREQVNVINRSHHQQQQPSEVNKLTALAQQIKHQAVDFFHGNHQHQQQQQQQQEAARNRLRQQVSAPRHLSLEEPEELVHWRPVIGGAATTGADTVTAKVVQEVHDVTKQQSLDTDSTWESSDDEDDEAVRSRTNYDSSQQQQRQANQSSLNKLAAAAADKGKGSSSSRLPVAREGLHSATTKAKLHNDCDDISIELNNNNIIISSSVAGSAVNKEQSQSNSSRQEQQVEPNAPISSSYLKLTTDEPNRLRLGREANKRLNSNEKKKSNDLAQQQQVVGDVESSVVKATGGAVSRPDLHSINSSQSNSNSNNNRSEQVEICKTTFEFNANLPTPAQLIELQHEASEQQQQQHPTTGNAAQLDADHSQLVESLVRGDSNLAALLDYAQPKKTSDTTTMAVIKQTTGAPVLKLQKPKEQQTSQESQDIRQVEPTGDPQAEDETVAKRLSVYENVDDNAPEQKVVTATSTASSKAQPQRKPRERQWRRPPQPPKPAHLMELMKAKTFASQVPQMTLSSSGARDTTTGNEWAVDDDDDDDNAAAIAAQVARTPSPRRSPIEIPAEQSAELVKEPARPKPKLIAMTSIIQEPEDELMIGASSSAIAGESSPNSSRSMLRRDSTFSQSFDLDNSNGNGNYNANNSSDNDSSSLAAATASRHRLVSKFEQQVTNRAQSHEPPRPKFPAFAEGRGAGSSGSSLVRRLARNFDQPVAAAASKPKLAPKPAGLTRPSPSQDDMSESSWYDAKGSGLAVDELDEAELAEFLRDFDQQPQVVTPASSQQPPASGGLIDISPTTATQTKLLQQPTGLTLTELSRSLSEIGSVSTGVDPFVTVAQSTLEEDVAEKAGGRQKSNGGAGNDDNDDNDDDDDDTLNDDVEQLAEETASLVVVVGDSTSGGVAAEGVDNDLDNADSEQQPLVASAGGQPQPQPQPQQEQQLSTGGSWRVRREAQKYNDAIKKNINERFTHCHIDDNKNIKIDKNPKSDPKQISSDSKETSLDPKSSESNPKETGINPREEDLEEELGFLEEIENPDNNVDHQNNDDDDNDNDSEKEDTNQGQVVSEQQQQQQLAATSRNLLQRPLSVGNSRHLVMSERDDQISLSSSSVSDETDYSTEDFSELALPELRQRQNLQRLYHVVNEIYSSEAKFVDTLHLLNVDLRRHLVNNQAPMEFVDSLLRHLPQLQALNENLLGELKVARDCWPEQQKIAHVLVKIGPFLKHYSSYIREFETIQQQLQDNMRKHPQSFGDLIRKFEASERAQRLSIQHHLLKPIQRIPQYRLLLQQYLQHLKPDDLDYEDTVLALEVVSRVAEHANQAMREGANFAKLLALQAKIVGKQRDIVQPGRLFVKEGELLKVCRKQVQPRNFVLLNDALLYLAAIQSSDILYLKNELPLDDCLVSATEDQDHSDREFSVCTRTRSFALIARSRQERDEWLEALQKTIDEHQAKRRSFQQVRAAAAAAAITASTTTTTPQPTGTESSQQLVMLAQNQLLGQRAPIWMPDARATSCQLCTSGFSALFRRHHCRACGRVVCSACSANKAPLVYLKCRAARVCDQCFEQLKASLHLYYLPRGPTNGNATCSNGQQTPPLSEEELRRLDEHFLTLLKSQFVRHANLRKLHRLARNTSGSKINRHSTVEQPTNLLMKKQEQKEQSDNNNHHQQHHHHHQQQHHKRHVLCEVGAALVQLASSSSSSSLSAAMKEDKVKEKEKKKLIK